MHTLRRDIISTLYDSEPFRNTCIYAGEEKSVHVYNSRIALYSHLTLRQHEVIVS